MDNESMATYVAIGTLILSYGVPLTITLLGSLQTDNPTAEDILALKGRVPHPDTM